MGKIIDANDESSDFSDGSSNSGDDDYDRCTMFGNQDCCCKEEDYTATLNCDFESWELPSYTMSLKILEELGPDCVYDSHCHLDFILCRRTRLSSGDEFESFVEKYPLMKHPSLGGFITNFCCPSLWSHHLVINESSLMKSLLGHNGVFYTIGCHPNYAEDMIRYNKFRHMEDLVAKFKADPNCVAIGECGLDTSKKDGATMTDQIEVFKFQIKLAMNRSKPLVLHIRGAEKEALRVLDEIGLPPFWPIHRHCWNDTWEVCQEWLDRFPESVIGLTALITYPGKKDLRRVVEKIPLNRLVLETDAPYFLPRGGGPGGLLGHSTQAFSVPLHAVNVAAQVAAIQWRDINDVLKANRANIKRVYGIGI